jgi:hypothetical protein
MASGLQHCKTEAQGIEHECVYLHGNFCSHGDWLEVLDVTQVWIGLNTESDICVLQIGLEGLAQECCQVIRRARGRNTEPPIYSRKPRDSMSWLKRRQKYSHMSLTKMSLIKCYSETLGIPSS